MRLNIGATTGQRVLFCKKKTNLIVVSVLGEVDHFKDE